MARYFCITSLQSQVLWPPYNFLISRQPPPSTIPKHRICISCSLASSSAPNPTDWLSDRATFLFSKANANIFQCIFKKSIYNTWIYIFFTSLTSSIGRQAVVGGWVVCNVFVYFPTREYFPLNVEQCPSATLGNVYVVKTFRCNYFDWGKTIQKWVVRSNHN